MNENPADLTETGGDPSKNVSDREKELLIRDLAVRGALMELKAKQSELIETNEQLNHREKELLLRDLEVRSMLMEVKVAKEELTKQNEHLSGREKELIMRDLEVRTVLMELKVAQEQLTERHSELESIMNIVREINHASDLSTLLQVMLTQLMHILPVAEKGSFLLYSPERDDYYFAASSGYELQLIEATRLSRPQLNEYYLKEEFLISDGVYLIRFNPEKEEKDDKLFIKKPLAAIALPIFLNGNQLKGMLFLDNFSSADSFKEADVNKVVRFKEHAISAFSKVALLNELNSRNTELESTLNDLKNAQDQLILSEKMAALGQVISNIAHEVNTPISAINGAAIYILNNLPALLESLPYLFKSLDANQEELFFRMINLSLKYSGDQMTTNAERKHRKDVQEALESIGIYQDINNISRKLVQCGVVTDVESFLPLIQHPQYNEILNAVSQIGRVRLHINNIVLSVTKAQRSIGSYKSFTEIADPNNEETINFNESIESVLNVFWKTSDDRLIIKTDFDEFLPSIRCFPVQLNQIWTHIIHNALHAMGNKGSLTVKTYLKNGRACAAITDTGPGIPLEIHHQIFEPFFTTKTEGEGGGLGLHVVQKFVQNHMGSVEFFSVPGETTFVVSIPYNREMILTEGESLNVNF